MDVQQLRFWYDIFKDGNKLTEIRVIDPTNNKIYSGYFTDVDTIIRELAPFDHANVYYTLNAIKEACYSRMQKDKLCRAKATTSDSDILGYDWLLIDLDCERPTDCCSSDEELQMAKDKANEVYKFLKESGTERPVVLLSGSGVHLYLKINIKNDDEGRALIKNFLQALDMLFSDEHVKIDCSTFNPARISRVAGCFNRKGSDTKERPQRMAQIVSVPSEVKITQKEVIQKIASIVPVPEQPSRANNYAPTGSFDLDAFLEKYDIKVYKRQQCKDYEKIVLETCPFNSAHGHDSALFRFTNGAYSFKCLHASDSQYTFRDFRLLYDPHAYDRKTYNEYVHKRNYYGAYQPQMFVPESETAEKGKVWLEMTDIEDTELNPKDYYPSGLQTLDDYILGMKRGQISVWTGRQASGKSTLMSQLILNAVQRNLKVALFTGEMSRKEIRTWMMLQAAGKAYNKPSQYNSFFYTPKPIKEKIAQWLSGKFFLYNNEYSPDILNLEDKIRKLHAEVQLSEIFIDNLMVLEIDELGEKNEYTNQKKLLKKLTDLARELDVHIHLIAHPNKNREWLDVASVCGSSNIGNLAQNVFLLSKIYPENFEQQAQGTLSKKQIADILASKCSTILQIGKCRDKGTAIGKIVKLWFETESNRLKTDEWENFIYGWADEPHQIDMPLDPIQYDTPFASASSDFDPFAPADPDEPIPF